MASDQCVDQSPSSNKFLTRNNINLARLLSLQSPMSSVPSSSDALSLRTDSRVSRLPALLFAVISVGLQLNFSFTYVQQGGQWHIPFAVGNRAPWGVRGAWFVVSNRLILSFCWYVLHSFFVSIWSAPYLY
jgi:hypothetical protein